MHLTSFVTLKQKLILALDSLIGLKIGSNLLQFYGLFNFELCQPFCRKDVASKMREPKPLLHSFEPLSLNLCS